MKKFLEIIKSKWLIRGTTTLLLILIIIALYIGINIISNELNIADLDFTEKKLYSLSDETKSKLKNLEQDVIIQLINTSDYTYLTDYAKKYETISDKIKVEEITDLSSRVDLKTEYNLEDTDMLIVIKEGDQEQVIHEYDLYTYDYSSGKQIDLTEEAITNAIVGLSITDKPKVYIFSGKTLYNPEQSLYSIVNSLTQEANDVEYLDMLSTGEVPEDCDCLIITTLSQDLNELERDKILEYIRRGGKIMLLTSQNIVEEEMPNLKQIFNEYGLNINYGVIFEQDTSKMLQNAPEFAITDAYASFMQDIDMSLKMCFVDAGRIEFADDEKLEELGVTYETIAKTGETSFIRTNFESQSYTKTDEDGDEGEFIVGAYVTKKISDDITSELIIYSSEVSASNMQIPISSEYYLYAIDLHNNEDAILNSISHLTERTDTITIRKDDDSEVYTVSEQEDIIIRIIIFAVPVIIIFIGVIVAIIRKRRK